MQTFKIYYRGKYIEVPCDDINFNHGFSVVDVEIEHNKEKKVIRGLIDKNYNTIFPFEVWNEKIEILSINTIVVTTIYEGSNRITSTTIFKIVNKKAKYLKEVDYYEKINDDVIKVGLNDKEFLLNINTNKVISYSFDKISKFIKTEIGMISKAIYILELKDGIKTSIICYIDELGKIKSPFYDINMNKIIDINEYETFENQILRIKEYLEKSIEVKAKQFLKTMK